MKDLSNLHLFFLLTIFIDFFLFLLFLFLFFLIILFVFVALYNFLKLKHTKIDPKFNKNIEKPILFHNIKYNTR